MLRSAGDVEPGIQPPLLDAGSAGAVAYAGKRERSALSSQGLVLRKTL